jgi:hypothetical protein
LIEDSNAVCKLPKARRRGHGGLRTACRVVFQDTSRQALHPLPDMATLRDGGIAAH